MATIDTFEALLDELQAAALGVVAWKTVLLSIARQLGVDNVGLHKDYWRGGGWGFRVNGDDKVFDNYFRHYAGIHPLALRTLSTPAETVLTDQMIMPRTEFYHTEYYHDWARPNGYDQHLHIRLENDEQALVGLSVARSRSAPEFGATELAFARRLTPHLRRAVATYERFESVRQANAGLLEAFDRMLRGVFGLAADGGVMFANETARAMLARGDALRTDRGILIGIQADHTRILRRLVASAAGEEALAVLTFARADGRPPLRLEPVRLSAANRLTDQRTPLLLLLVHDPEAEAGATAGQLCARYGLTATEAAVAVLAARGKGLAAVAMTMGIGQGTVRSHLKRTFQKTQTNRQAELAWLVSQISGTS